VNRKGRPRRRTSERMGKKVTGTKRGGKGKGRQRSSERRIGRSRK